MSGFGAARRLLGAAALGGTGVALTGGALAGLLVTEAKLARRWVGVPKTVPPSDNGLWGSGHETPISFVMIGDSSAAGLGVERPEQTPGAQIAQGLAAIAERPVRLTDVALVGARSADLDRQVTLALAAAPDVAMIMIGANDITHRVSLTTAVSQLDAAVRRLRAAGVEVVVATCPDLGTIEPIAQPLRYLARRWSRQLAAAQTIVVVEAGGRTVSLGDLIGPEFSAAPLEMFSADRFHPSAAGYASAAMAVLPSVAAALGYWPVDEHARELSPATGMLPVAFAAVEAVEAPGTEVAPATAAEAGGDMARHGGLRGPWALLRIRRRPEASDAEAMHHPSAA
ncbi:MAG: SGNH/GDSL hydrolase family protein [Sporichthyaceae bacterium]